MRRRDRFNIPSKYVLAVLTFLCIGAMFLSFLTDFDGGPLNTVSNYILIPVQKGINAAGSWVRSRVDDLDDLRAVRSENEELRAQVAELTLENNALLQERYELENLRELLDLEEEYSELNTMAANDGWIC